MSVGISPQTLLHSCSHPDVGLVFSKFQFSPLFARVVELSLVVIPCLLQIFSLFRLFVPLLCTFWSVFDCLYLFQMVITLMRLTHELASFICCFILV